MLIQFNEAKNALEKENKNLGEKMDEARRQIDAIESLSLKDQGLTGAAYTSARLGAQSPLCGISGDTGCKWQ